MIIKPIVSAIKAKRLDLKIILLSIVFTIVITMGYALHEYNEDQSETYDLMTKHHTFLANTVSLAAVGPILTNDHPALQELVDILVKKNSAVLGIKIIPNNENSIPVGADIKTDEKFIVFKKYIWLDEDEVEAGSELGSLELKFATEYYDSLISTHLEDIISLSILFLIVKITSLLFIIRYNITKPLSLLVEQVRPLKTGDLTHKIELSTGDELTFLATVLEQMRKTVYVHTTHLEKLVEQRTDELNITITKLRSTTELLHAHTKSDCLTGIPNRKEFMNQLNDATNLSIEKDHQIAVLFVNLDRFKPINDVIGYDGGDTFLQTVALRGNSCKRQSDTFARLGGDEFVVLLHDVKNKSEVEEFAAKLLTIFNNPFKIGKHDLNIEASIGISIGTGAKDYLGEADKAMYIAKKKGNTFAFFE